MSESPADWADSGNAATDDAAAEPAQDAPTEPTPLGLEPAVTGNADVDAVLQRLADVDGLSTDGHIDVYEDVHASLRDILTALDSRPGPPPPKPSAHTRS